MKSCSRWCTRYQLKVEAVSQQIHDQVWRKNGEASFWNCVGRALKWAKWAFYHRNKSDVNKLNKTRQANIHTHLQLSFIQQYVYLNLSWQRRGAPPRSDRRSHLSIFFIQKIGMYCICKFGMYCILYIIYHLLNIENKILKHFV